MIRRHLSLLIAVLLGSTTTAGFALSEERLAPGIYPAAPVPEAFAIPAEPNHPPFELDWSVGLKGSYTSATTGDSFVTSLNPQFTATHDGLRANIVIDGSAEIVKPIVPSTEIEPTALRLGISAVAPIDSQTTATVDATLRFDQEGRWAPGRDPLVIVPPEVLTGAVGAGVERSFGRFNVALRGDAQRTLYGPTERADTGLTDNSEQNLWALDSTLRVGFQATPILEVFTEASLGRDIFDRPSAFGVKTDATDMALRGGIAGEWNGTLRASVSAGYGYHNFDDAALGDVASQLYDASVTFTPDSTLSLTARLRTSIDPVGADARGTARITNRAEADLSYVLNSRLRLRASADWSRSDYTASPEVETVAGVGTGVDYRLNSYTALAADYGYSRRDNSVSGRLDSHTVSLGVTVQR